MRKKFFKLCFALLLAFAMFGAMLTGAAVPVGNDAVVCVSGFASYVSSTPFLPHHSIVSTAANIDFSTLKLYPGGVPFGVKFMTEGVIITGFSDIKAPNGKICPATDAGLRQNDIIVKVNGDSITDASHLLKLAEQSGGNAMSIIYLRNGKQERTSLKPAYCTEDGKYKTGMYVRDSGAGIGTVTYIVPETLTFGGLGHGICDSQTGKLVSMQRGSVIGVTINGVVKGLSGAPGEVRGYFGSGKTGTLLQNTDCGVFGAFVTLPEGLMYEPMSVGTRNGLKAGKAVILSTLDGTAPVEYEIEICDINVSSTTNKCFTVKVTDKALLEKTGGIIQGMSGSPIIQEGKLVGAVTHVLVNDPTTGYGIFIENMLKAAHISASK